MNGSDINMEELMKLEPDVVFYNAGSKEIGEALRSAGFAAVAVSVNKWNYDSIETYDQWISLLSQISRKRVIRRSRCPGTARTYMRISRIRCPV